MHDDAFEATYAKNVKNMFRMQVSTSKKSLTLKWKSQVLDFLIFRESLRDASGVDTSSTTPLRAST